MVGPGARWRTPPEPRSFLLSRWRRASRACRPSAPSTCQRRSPLDRIFLALSREALPTRGGQGESRFGIWNFAGKEEEENAK